MAEVPKIHLLIFITTGINKTALKPQNLMVEFSVPTVEVQGVLGKKGDLPCDITPRDREDAVAMVLWFKETVGEPLYREKVTVARVSCPKQCENKPAPVTRSKIRGGLGQQDPDRNRRDDLPANEPRNEPGTRKQRSQIRCEEQQQAQTEEVNVVADTSPQPTTSSRQKQRTTWTRNMNEFVVRCYYRLTRLETSGEVYYKELHKKVTQEFPELRKKTVQNILDQKRSIFRNNRLDANTINRIRDEVAIELGLKEDTGEETEEQQIIVERTEETKYESEFLTQHLKYHELQPLNKPRLPKLITNDNTEHLVNEVNAVLATKINEDTTIEELHSILYSGAVATLVLNGQRINEGKELKSKLLKKKPAWQRRMETKIALYRKQIGILTSSKQITASEKTKNNACKIINTYKSPENMGYTEVLDLIKQKLAAMARRLRRHKKSNERRLQNNLFSKNEKAFYKNLQKKEEFTDTPPESHEVLEFWKRVWETPGYHREDKWYRDEKRKSSQIRAMSTWEISKEEIEVAVKKTLSWKAAGPDKLQNFWLKKFTSAHEQLARCLTNLFANKQEHLVRLVETVGKFSTDINMSFGMDKCKMSSMKKGKWIKNTGYTVDNQGKITGMEEAENYTYLGYAQAQGIEQKTCKKKLVNTYLTRLRALLKTELSARNMSKAVNTYATAVLEYSFGVINWTKTELHEFDIMTRREYRKYRGHHPHSAVERFHLPRHQGGRGVPSIFTRCQKQIDKLRTYFVTKSETTEFLKNIIRTDTNVTPMCLANKDFDPLAGVKSVQELKTKWRSKPLHGKYLVSIEHDHIDTIASQMWLRNGAIFNETEGFILAIQDQVVATRSYRRRIMKQRLENIKCRMCGNNEETLDHIIASCSVLAPKQYLDRHNKVAMIIHQELRKIYMKLENIVPCYKYEPPAVCEDEKVRIYWNRKIQTDRRIECNIPDIVLSLKDKKVTYIIDIAVPLSANVTATYAEKVNKYLPLADEIGKMWRMEKVQIVPIVIGCT
ncbi:unnamed protein product, partial [Callosobruchus maculatus]